MTVRQAGALSRRSICSVGTIPPASRAILNARRFASLAAFVPAVLALTACAGTPTLPDDPFEGDGPVLSMVLVNHTDRYAMNSAVDKYWAGAVMPHSGGAGRVCCYPGLKDWSQPVTVRWTWGDESAKDGKPAKPVERHVAVMHFPAGGPKNSERDPAVQKNDRYLCLILRDLDTAELAFSPSASGCASK